VRQKILPIGGESSARSLYSLHLKSCEVTGSMRIPTILSRFVFLLSHGSIWTVVAHGEHVRVRISGTTSSTSTNTATSMAEVGAVPPSVMAAPSSSSSGSSGGGGGGGGGSDDEPSGRVEVKRCGTPPMNDNDRKALRQALAFVRLKQTKRREARTEESRRRAPLKTITNDGEPKERYELTEKIIPVCFHIVGSSVYDITNEDLDADLDALNKAFSDKSCCDPSESWCTEIKCSVDTNIRFVMARLLDNEIIGTTSKPSNLFSCVKYKSEAVDLEDIDNYLAVATEMKVGDGRVLNVYFGQIAAAGYAYGPTILKTDPILDGVRLDPYYRFGVAETESEGDTLAHEVGYVYICKYLPSKKCCY